MLTSPNVRKPAGLRWNSRLSPMAAPHANAVRRRSTTSLVASGSCMATGFIAGLRRSGDATVDVQDRAVDERSLGAQQKRDCVRIVLFAPEPSQRNRAGATLVLSRIHVLKRSWRGHRSRRHG